MKSGLGEGKEAKGNVLVSVRCRPDAEGQNGDAMWLVEGRNSRVVYKGNEGGEYVYGLSLLCP